VVPIESPEPQPTPRCFQTQGEVDSYLADLTSPRLGARSAAASVVIGTMYKDDNYGGGSYTFYGSGSCSGVTYGFPSLSADWQNTISSAKAFASCWVTLYDAPSYGGNRYNCTPNCASLPSFNDRTKSLVFRPAGTVG
ncbi:peptidase inhibitor family I36 protein, partial [Staphylococcus aureus]|uniref:peptidase inhibitor family I36 protein n=1 Tax=Staphylococcus aureus TaxID=1280 RepID=UPI003D19388C